MRREVLYQYDLPIEVLDAIPADEEVVSVLFGRSKERYLIPILFSKKRILWAYPEQDSIYKVFEQHYIEINAVSAKFQTAASASVTLDTTTRKIVFPNIQNSVEDVRGALLTVADELKTWTGIHWEILQQKNLLADEYLIQKNLSVPVGECTDDELFEEKIRITTPHTTLFTHFSTEGEDDVFEEKEQPESVPSSAMVDRISRMVQATEPAKEPGPKPKNDAVIYDTSSGEKNEQWHNCGGGDAEILPRGRPWKTMGVPTPSKKPVPHETFSPEDDDSEVYVSDTPRPKLVVPSPKVVVEVIGEQPKVEAKTLQPKAGIDEATIDKSLEALKFLKDNNIISEAEYKKRSLSLFEKEE